MSERLLALALLLPLAACTGQPTDEERANLKRALPDGCTFNEVGSYGGIRDLVFIRCDGRATTTSYMHWTEQHGKTRSSEYAVAFVIEARRP